MAKLEKRKTNRKTGLGGVWLYLMNDDGTTYKQEGMVLNAESFQYTENYKSQQGYSNNVIDTDFNKISHCEISITVADLTDKEKAMLRGSKDTKGGLAASIGDIQPSFGVIAKVTLANGQATYVVFYSVKLKPDGETAETERDNPNLGTIVLKGLAIPNEEGIVYRELTTGTTELDDTKIAKLEETFPTKETDFKKGI